LKLFPFFHRFQGGKTKRKGGSMSIERALIAQAQPFMVASWAQALIREELVKGCQPEISAIPLPRALLSGPLGYQERPEIWTAATLDNGEIHAKR